MNAWQRAARRPDPVEVGLGLAFAVALASWSAQIAWARGGGQWQVGCVAGVVVCALALVRRRHPGRAATAGLLVAAAAVLVARSAGLPSEPGPATTLALAVLVGSAVRTLPALQAVAVAAGGCGVVVLSGFAALSTGVPTVMALNGTGWFAAVVTGAALRLFDHRHRAVSAQVRRDVRLDLARELHDVVAHHVTGIVLQAQAAQIVARKQPDRLDESLAGIEAAGGDALAAIRRVVGLLRDTTGDDASLTAPEPLDALVRRFARHGRTVRLRQPDADTAWSPEVRMTLYRVVQESLTNIARHAAHARSVTVEVAQVGTTVTVEVTDDAERATDHVPRRAGYGLVGMRERVEALGGSLDAGPRPVRGWFVRAALPVPGPPASPTNTGRLGRVPETTEAHR